MEAAIVKTVAAFIYILDLCFSIKLCCYIFTINKIENMKSTDKKLVNKLKTIIDHKFPNIMNEIIVYGSRGLKNKLDADFDLTVITNLKLGWQEQRSIKSVIYNYGIDNDIVFDPKIISLQELNGEKSKFTFKYKVKNSGISV